MSEPAVSDLAAPWSNAAPSAQAAPLASPEFENGGSIKWIDECDEATPTAQSGQHGHAADSEEEGDESRADEPVLIRPYDAKVDTMAEPVSREPAGTVSNDVTPTAAVAAVADAAPCARAPSTANSAGGAEEDRRPSAAAVVIDDVPRTPKRPEHGRWLPASEHWAWDALYVAAGLGGGALIAYAVYRVVSGRHQLQADTS